MRTKITLLLGACIGGAASTVIGHETGEILPQNLPEDRCPELSEVAAASWVPERLSELSKEKTGCVASVRRLRSRNSLLTLIQYVYSFKEADGYVSQQQFNFIIRAADRVVLWRYDATGYPGSSLSKVDLIELQSRDLLELQFFTGGSAGFWEEYLSVSGNRLEGITESFVESAKPLIPFGWERRRVRISFPELRATMYLATSNDRSCPQSGRLELTLHLKENDLVLVDGRFHRDRTE